jgi:predicted HD phosphohydrolase
MIAIYNATSQATRTYTTEEIIEFFDEGLTHERLDVRQTFRQAIHLGARAASENAETALTVAALLYYPCHMLARSDYLARPWTGDSILESGTYDWLTEHFGQDVAEWIRMQPHARRYLASVVPHYFNRLDMQLQQVVLAEGSFMTPSEKSAFAESRHFVQSLRLLKWIDQGIDKWIEAPDVDFFALFLELSMNRDSVYAHH